MSFRIYIRHYVLYWAEWAELGVAYIYHKADMVKIKPTPMQSTDWGNQDLYYEWT